MRSRLAPDLAIETIQKAPWPSRPTARHRCRTTSRTGQPRVLICDRDTKWSAPVRAQLREAGIRVVQTPYPAPNANAYAERFVRSIKEECLHRVIPFRERHLRRTIAAYVEHYHRERNHQGIENELIEGAPATSLELEQFLEDLRSFSR
jgi:transposase InsO family protein